MAGLLLMTSSSLLTQSTLELKFWHMKYTAFSSLPIVCTLSLNV